MRGRRPFAPAPIRPPQQYGVPNSSRRHVLTYLIDRRLQSKNKSAVNRERFLRRYKSQITVHEKAHRYHFGTHSGVARSEVQEYLIVGQ